MNIVSSLLFKVKELKEDKFDTLFPSLKELYNDEKSNESLKLDTMTAIGRMFQYTSKVDINELQSEFTMNASQNFENNRTSLSLTTSFAYFSSVVKFQTSEEII